MMLVWLFWLLMLSIGKIALGQHRYYERQVAQGRDDYYSGRGEAAGEWVGAGSDALGLSGRTPSQRFSALIAGQDPRDPGERLRSSERDPKVAALDLTFSAPKSVSVLAAVGPDRLAAELIWAHEQAVRAALSYLEDAAVRVRRGHDGERVERGAGLIAVAYRHRMSRALDPQLHTHVVAANLTRGPDGRYTALHGAPLYRAAKTAGYLYQSHLRAIVSERLGLTWGEVHKGAAELEGVPNEVLQEFSKRRREMLHAAEEGGIPLTSKAAAESAAIATRDRKRYGIDTHTWREEVRARAGELGLTRAAIGTLIERGRRRTRAGLAMRAPVDERSLGDRLTSPQGLTERANTFDERAVLQEFAAHARSGLSVDEVRAQARRLAGRPDVIHTERGEMTTAELLACEKRLIAAALGRAGECAGIVAPDLIHREISRAPFQLTDEQTTAVNAAIDSGDGVSVIEALAGTGKTFTAGALGAIYRRSGHEVLGVAPTARAARELSEQAGIPSRTLDRLLLDIHQLGDELPHRCVVIFDEAGMAPTRSSALLLTLAARARAKMIAIGDPGQLASVQAGGWLRAVGRDLGAHRLTEVMRQRDPGERRALAALHEREPHRYLQWAERARRIEAWGSAAVARERAVEEWQEAVRQVGPTEAVMIARDNDTRDSLNTAARELCRALGLLGEERTYGRLPLAEGERVICRRNDRMIEVDNGMRGTVRHLDRDRVVIQTDGGRVRELPASYVAEHLEHAYALTAHGMQGGTVERAIVVASPRDLTAGWSYTALSRARRATRLVLHEREVGADRGEFAPVGQTRNESTDLLARVARHMRDRDDEDLAIEQLPSGPDEIELGADAPKAASQQIAAARRALQGIEDFDARLSALSTQHERLTQRLEQLARTPGQQRRDRDAKAPERAHLDAAMAECTRELGILINQRNILLREAGGQCERDRLERAIRQYTPQHRQVREEQVERELGSPGR
jgi:conjugative relaxase-like TrwC/TraI family protein